MKTIDPILLEQALSYIQYHQMMAELVQHQESINYNEGLINYTRMNIIRMERLDKTTKLQAATQVFLEKIGQPLQLLVLTEPWCGDAAQIIPVLNKLTLANPNIKLSLLLRDQHLDLMDQYLTDGSRSIPIILVLDPTSENKVLGTWGPRPFIAQGMMLRGLNQWRTMKDGEAKDLFHRDLYTKLQKWYARDKTNSIQEEFIAYLEKILAM